MKIQKITSAVAIAEAEHSSSSLSSKPDSSSLSSVFPSPLPGELPAAESTSVAPPNRHRPPHYQISCHWGPHRWRPTQLPPPSPSTGLLPLCSLPPYPPLPSYLRLLLPPAAPSPTRLLPPMVKEEPRSLLPPPCTAPPPPSPRRLIHPGWRCCRHRQINCIPCKYTVGGLTVVTNQFRLSI